MKQNKKWLWNGVIVLTIFLCGLAFVLHYKNWEKIEEGNFQVMSGIYKKKIPLTAINEVDFVARIPELERKNGFSWLTREKGVFLDSLTGAKVYVFVDDLKQEKLQVRHHDSLFLYFNHSDSVKTRQVYEKLLLFAKQNAENPN